MTFFIRKPAVAGSFYPLDPEKLKQQIASFVKPITKKIKVKGIVVPHAGYIYSGGVAGKVYSQIEIPDRLIILSPNHTGLGVPFSINTQGVWETPLGEARIDKELAGQLMEMFSLLEEDHRAHAREHSLEVQLPFIQYLKKDFTFVPITLSHVSLEHCLKLGEAIAQVVTSQKNEVLLVASSDMNHYEEHEYTLRVDQLAIDKILRRDPAGLYHTVHEKNISMCGIIPTTVMLAAVNEWGTQKATLVDHQTSGPTSGDYNRVVGYAGIVID